MEELKKIMEKLLKENGIDATKEKLDELYDVYENCQEWDDGEMLTGNTFDEIEDFIKYSPCVEEIIGGK